MQRWRQSSRHDPQWAGRNVGGNHKTTRLRTLWLGLALLLLLIVQQVPLLPWNGRLATGISNGTHGLWFAALTVLVHALIRRGWTGKYAIAATVLVAIILAFATEALQLATGRSAQLQDIACDLLGATAAVLLVAARSGRLPKAAVSAGASVLLAVTLTPAIVAGLVQFHRNAIFPVLVDFSAYRFGGLLTSNSTIRAVPTGDNATALEIVLGDDPWPGVHLDEPVPDWHDFEALEVDVFVPETSAPVELNVSIRLRNARVDHVYKTFVLASGSRTLHLALHDLFDPSTTAVTGVVIYSERAFAGRRVELRRVALVRNGSGLVGKRGGLGSFGQGLEWMNCSILPSPRGAVTRRTIPS